MARSAIDSDETDDDYDHDDMVARLPEKSRQPKQTGTCSANQPNSYSQNVNNQHRNNFQSVRESLMLKKV